MEKVVWITWGTVPAQACFRVCVSNLHFCCQEDRQPGWPAEEEGRPQTSADLSEHCSPLVK